MKKTEFIVMALLMLVGSLLVCREASGAVGERAIATIRPLGSAKVSGTVELVEQKNGVQILARLQGLEPGSEHGFHVHEFGDCTDDKGERAGAHFNPLKSPHALPPTKPRHVGDFGNIKADEFGKINLQVLIENLAIESGEYSLIGRAVVLHEHSDRGVQPSGDSGGRIGCGVLGLAQ